MRQRTPAAMPVQTLEELTQWKLRRRRGQSVGVTNLHRKDKRLLKVDGTNHNWGINREFQA